MLRNKIAIISGGTRGIGRAIALELAEKGADIAFNYASASEHAESLCKEIQTLGRRCKGYQVSITDYEGLRNMVNDIEEQWGPVDIVVNNAGVTADAALVTMSVDNWHKVIDTNLNGTFYLTKAVITSMMKRKAGTIVNISSVAGTDGAPRQTNYSASKAGIIGFTQALAKEVGGYGIRVNAVAPGFIETDMTKGLDEKVSSALLKRKGTAGEVARLVSYLCSEDAGYIIGQTIKIDGGLIF